MKRQAMVWMTILMTVFFGLTVVSCSKKDDSRSAKPPGHDKMLQDRVKEIEASKKIVVARVNGTEIRMDELVQRMNFIAPKYAKSPQEMTPDLDRKVKKEALDILIFRELAVQEAVRQGISVPPDTLDARLKQIREESGPEEAFKKKLQMMGQSEESFRKMTERNLLFDMISNREIFQKVRVSDKRLRETYRKDKAKLLKPETIAVDEVLIATGSDEAAAMKKANEVLALIRKNDNDVMRTPKESGVQVRQGQMTKAEYPKIATAAERMQPGDVSGVIREDDGLHIVKIIGREPARQLSFEEARPLIENELMPPLVAKQKQEWEAELKKNAKIEILLDPEVAADKGARN